jgi:hypothetical protein
MRRHRFSSRAAFGSSANEESDSDGAPSSSRGKDIAGNDDEDDDVSEDDDEEEDEDAEIGDEYKDSYVNQIFRKEYKQVQVRKDSAYKPPVGTVPRAASRSHNARSSGRTRRTIDYKERQIKDIPFRSPLLSEVSWLVPISNHL